MAGQEVCSGRFAAIEPAGVKTGLQATENDGNLRQDSCKGHLNHYGNVVQNSYHTLSLFLPLPTVKTLVVFEVNNLPCHMLVGHTQLCAVMGHGFSYHG